ncbi:MAG: glutamine-hydrolyzing carbamoyl-phosphate synthase small subunit [Deltaproteobacteria bacterium]|nr:glutamine-hydrolyzing carbamoyl-phosphate synthase small subunit [Deltaproteobacteria bacterium]
MKAREAHLILADGTIFSGTSFGYAGGGSGEVVFNTSMSGYQEILTDPSYEGQIVVMTYPQIGNYGINPQDVESKKIYLSGFVVKEVSPVVSNYRSRMDLSSYLQKNKIPGIAGIDTRALVRKIREAGAMQALIRVGAIHELPLLRKKAAALAGMEGQDLAKIVSHPKGYGWKEGVHRVAADGTALPKKGKRKFKVVAYDFGIKQNILRMLTDQGCDVSVVPAEFSAEKVLALKPDGIFLSNGPGDPAVCDYAVQNVKKLIGKKPVFGICLGHQILGLALGAKTFKLKFGHHGGNQPVKDLTTGKVEITAQNHGFAVDPESLPKDVEVTHINLNDQTVEGLRHKKWKAFSVQYHPEASPGPHDSHYLFSRFIRLMEQRR